MIYDHLTYTRQEPTIRRDGINSFKIDSISQVRDIILDRFSDNNGEGMHAHVNGELIPFAPGDNLFFDRDGVVYFGTYSGEKPPVAQITFEELIAESGRGHTLALHVGLDEKYYKLGEIKDD